MPMQRRKSKNAKAAKYMNQYNEHPRTASSQSIPLGLSTNGD
jgi:hypothetical protein